MKKHSYVFAALACLVILAGQIAGGQDAAFRTALTPDGLGIVRHPGPLDLRRIQSGKLKELPVFNPASTTPFQVDLRSLDLSAWNLADKARDLSYAAFDDDTIWPKALPAGFAPAAIMEAGKNPGLGIRELHRRRVTGRGVGIAVIDQALLVDHVEYKDRLRLYEEIHNIDDTAAIHGPAVASIAVGKTVGVAPEADLYYIAETHGSMESGRFVFDFTYLAQSIDRILAVNKGLPADRKIRVISISVGWTSEKKGYAEVKAAAERAKKEGLFVVSTALSATYDGKLNFQGLDRNPSADPEQPGSFRPGLWWVDQFWGPSPAGQSRLLIPMDSRTTAGPTGNESYVFYRQGGLSWSVPYIAGLYALACQIKPDITPEVFWAKALETGDSVDIPARRAMPSEADLAVQIGKILDERIEFMKPRLQGVPMEKALAEVYSRMGGTKVETMSEAAFRAWAAAGPIRDMAVGDTKPKALKTIVNPARLMEALRARD